MRKLVLAAMCLVAGGVAFKATSSSAGPETEKPLEAIKGYQKWKKVTERPVDMSPAQALSCAGPQPRDMPPNVHVAKVFYVYVNKTGEAAMMKKGGDTRFPDGTVIVKEKYDRPPVFQKGKVDTKPYGAVGKPELLTVMVKQGGEWKYFACDRTGKVMKGDMTYCRKCHESVRGTDYTFRTYMLGGQLVPRSGH